jgi:HAMP domain-containing protein
MKTLFVGIGRFFHFRSFQQKIGVYSFVLSLAAVASASFFTYQIASEQVKLDRGLIMEVQARQISRILTIELESAAEDVRLWRNTIYIIDSVKQHSNEPANAFLTDVVKGRLEKYDLLFTIDSEGRICAINEDGQSLIGERYSDVLEGLDESWRQEVIGSDDLKVIGWRQIPAVNALYNRTTDDNLEQKYQIGLASTIRDRESGENFGILVAIMNWSAIQSILDTAETFFSQMDLDSGYAYLFDNDADTIIGHKYKDHSVYGTSLTKDQDLPDLYHDAVNRLEGIQRYEWTYGPKVAYLTFIQPERLNSQIVWTLGVGIDDKDIYEPVQTLKKWFFLIPLIVAAIVAFISFIFGRRISMSLQQFAQLARDASRGRFVPTAAAGGRDELGNLARAFNEMLVSFRSQQPFASIPNPYVVGNPIRTNKMFYGRQQDLTWLRHHLENAGNKMILLFGARRIGKTSLLHQINGGHAGEAVLPFFFDTQQFIPELSDDNDFYHILTRDLLSQLSQKLPDIRAPFIAAERFTPQTFRNLLSFISEMNPGRRPVLLFDELENLEYKLARGNLTPDVFLFLAGLLDSALDVSFVVTGSNRLETKRLPDWNILIPKTISRRIGLLAPEDARILIEQPVHGYVVYGAGIPDRILRLTAGHPYYTQLICLTQIDCLNRDKEFAAGAEQLEKVIQLVLHNPPPPLNHVWENFSLSEKIAVATTASVIENENDYVGADTVLETVPQELKELLGNEGNIRSALDTLSLDDWVERSDRSEYRFRIDLLRLWIRHEHTIWHLVDELKRSEQQ